MSFKEGEGLIFDYISNYHQLKAGKDPYVISLRCVNWIKFISKHKEEFKSNQNYSHINGSLYAQYKTLLNNLEYHLMGNHLIENGLSLLFGAYYFRDENLFKVAKNIILNQLDEQILDDGAHFELSPMYHSIILYRILDCINLLENNSFKENDDLIDNLKITVQKMLSWLQKIKYRNNNIPHVNDSTFNIAPTVDDILIYAEILKVKQNEEIKLSESGYRKFENSVVEFFIDVGNIGPDYIPGHAHADTFSFEFYYKKRPIIIDMGISTYEHNIRRQLERSTESHNTIKVGDKNSSHVWSSFRVANRAKIINLKENKNYIESSHDGYKKIGVIHKRVFDYREGNSFTIEDSIFSSNHYKIESNLHFHPDCTITLKGNQLIVDDSIFINFLNYTQIELKEFDYPLGYNRYKKANKICGIVNKLSKIQINYEN